jgi:hypothetical protein
MVYVHVFSHLWQLYTVLHTHTQLYRHTHAQLYSHKRGNINAKFMCLVKVVCFGNLSYYFDLLNMQD